MNRNRTKQHGHRHSLARNILLTILVVSITPMVLVSGIILYQFNVSHHDKVEAHIKELVQKHKQNIDFFLEEKLSDIRSLAKTFSFEELSDESFLEDRLALLQQQYRHVFVDVGVINNAGLQLAYAGPFKLGKALYSNASWFKDAMKSEYVISDVFLGLRGLPHFIVAVRDNWNGEPWILRSTIDFVAFNDLVENIRIGETGFAYILNKEGAFQTKPVHKILPNPGRYLEKISKDGEDTAIQIFEQPDEAGKKNIYASAELKGGDWILIYQQRASDAYSEFRKAFKLTILINLLGGLGIIIMAYFLSKRMVNRIDKLDKEKRMMNEQVVETGKLASVGELAAGIAHEINNPVAIMVEEAGWIEDLLEDEDLGKSKNVDEFKRALEQIRSQGKRCKEITHKLLSFARKTDSKVQEVDLNELIEEIVALSMQRAKYSNVTIKTDLQENLPALHVSQAEFQQVLLNLINNSLDALERKGGMIEVNSYTRDNSVIVEVTDNGPGIPKANLNRIFDPFFTTKPVGKGTGLGLSICYGIIKKLGGVIDVRSSIDRGTTFLVRLPSPGQVQIEDENEPGKEIHS